MVGAILFASFFLHVIISFTLGVLILTKRKEIQSPVILYVALFLILDLLVFIGAFSYTLFNLPEDASIYLF